MRSTLLLLALCLGLSYGRGQSADRAPETEYLAQWQAFYPSRALAEGLHAAVFDYEDRSAERITAWLDFNKNTLARLSDPAEPYVRAFPIDARLLRLQARREIDRWEQAAPHRHSLSLYADLIAGAMDAVHSPDFLLASEKGKLACQRLTAVRRLCAAAAANLTTGERADLESGLTTLTRTESYYREELPAPPLPVPCADFAAQCETTAADIGALIEHVQTKLLPTAAASSPILGREAYARQLALYTDADLTPEALAEMARGEIETVRGLMGEVSRDYLQKAYPDQPLPADYDALVATALADMEKDAPANGEEYLVFWQELAAAAVQFIEENEIATLPPFQTLRILPAPESAGPSARIGWVDSAPPFAPNPLTTLYLPSIPDTLPAQEQRDFWASFNKPFNRMIVIHELFPGHYMQIKISRETPHPVRLLFPYGPYFEGWATFCERVLLDAGWEADDPLTFLAHLRKRLENANRAYTSVMAHCQGWDREQVLQFSTETSLLAPQFAKSLWGRLLRSPLQMTSYFLGGKQFSDLLAAEKERLGVDFILRDFMDTVMRAGPIPVDAFPALFSQNFKK